MKRNLFIGDLSAQRPILLHSLSPQAALTVQIVDTDR